MEWKSTLAEFSQDFEFTRGVDVAAVSSSEQQLGLALPPDLRELLMESDGVMGEYELGLVWPLARIVSDNLSFRNNPHFKELYMPFDSLLFFGDAGNGDQFAYPIQAGVVRNLDVFAWSHEDDSRTWIAPSLRKFFEWWSSGRIKL